MFFFAHTYTFTIVKEILLYDSIYSLTSQQFVTALEEAKDEDITVRINCDGGEVECGWAMIAKFAEHKGKKLVKVDAKAHSMGALFLCYADDVECLDVAEFLIHRASYGEWFEKSDYFSESLKGNLERMNKKLQAAFEAKVDAKEFEKLKGVKVKDVFSMDSRIDVFLTAAEAKKIGLVNTITKITPAKRAEIESYAAKIAARYTPKPEEKTAAEKEEIKPEKQPVMTLEELKSKHPDVYAAAVKAGKDAEKERIEALLVYNEVDPEAVKKAIEAGTEVGPKMMAEMQMKISAKSSLKTTETEGKEKGDGKTEEVTAEAEGKEKAKADFMKDVKANMTK